MELEAQVAARDEVIPRLMAKVQALTARVAELEGSDQHRGWFHSSILVAVGTRDTSPYKACLTHGFVVDGRARR